MSLKKIKKEYRETTSGEIRQAILENSVYGFLGSILVVFIAQRMDIAVLIGNMKFIIGFSFGVLAQDTYICTTTRTV
jgi:hypothetical protein